VVRVLEDEIDRFAEVVELSPQAPGELAQDLAGSHAPPERGPAFGQLRQVGEGRQVALDHALDLPGR
jgi:hypothetical protein